MPKRPARLLDHERQNLPRPLQCGGQSPAARAGGSLRALATSHREVSQVDRIRALVNEKMAELKQTIETQDRQGSAAAQAIVQTEEGRLTMDAAARACALVASGEYVSLFDRTHASELHASRSRLIVLVGCVGLVLLLFRLGTAVDKVVSEREDFARNVEGGRLLQTTLTSIGDAVIVTEEAALSAS